MEEPKAWYKRVWVWIGLFFLAVILLGLFLFVRQTYIYYQQIKSGQITDDFVKPANKQNNNAEVSEYQKLKVEQLKVQARGKYDQPYLGPEDAKHEVVEFVDFGCPYCKQALKEIHILADLRSDVKIIIRDYPIKELHANAETAAQAARCVWINDGQEKYWKYHDLLFANQSNQDLISLRSYAQTVGAKLDYFDQCMRNQAVASQIKLSIMDGDALGVRATPTFFIDGKKQEGVLTVEDFNKLLGE